MASKYAALTVWLRDCGQDTVRLTFSALGEIIPIPTYASRYRQAWENGQSYASPFQKGWLNAGYVVSAIDMTAGWVEFTKKEPQQRADEQTLAAVIRKGYKYYDDMRSDPHHRFRAWEHCHSAFRQRREDPDSVDTDTLCLHLAWYLASWGMLRNSFLQQKDYRIHESVIALLFEPEWNDLWDIPAERLAQVKTADRIMELGKRIACAYMENGSKEKPSDTLITKILLGTVGCTPAYDRYFKMGVGSTGAAPQRFSAKSLAALGALYTEYGEAFGKLRDDCSKVGVEYPAAKILDMCFFAYGLNAKKDPAKRIEE